MQGIVFTYKKKKQHARRFASNRTDKLKLFLKKWGSSVLFAVMFAFGLSVGCLTTGNFDSDTLKSLDFLFTTNLPQRLTGGAFGAFCAGFASDFLFFAAAFLMGLSVWGAVALPFISFFKGFGVGVSAGYLLMTYGFKGTVFYLSVLLPGIVVFVAALVYELSSAYSIFKRLCLTLFGKTRISFKEPFVQYLKSSLKYLIITFSASVLDAVLWLGLAGLFSF